jgi:hypothetical protein
VPCCPHASGENMTTVPVDGSACTPAPPAAGDLCGADGDGDRAGPFFQRPLQPPPCVCQHVTEARTARHYEARTHPFVRACATGFQAWPSDQAAAVRRSDSSIGPSTTSICRPSRTMLSRRANLRCEARLITFRPRANKHTDTRGGERCWNSRRVWVYFLHATATATAALRVASRVVFKPTTTTATAPGVLHLCTQSLHIQRRKRRNNGGALADIRHAGGPESRGLRMHTTEGP